MQTLTARFLLPVSGSLVENGAVVIDDDGKILDLGNRTTILPRYPNAAVEEFPQAVLMPGLVNAHTHLDLLYFNPDAVSEQRKAPFQSERPDFYDYLIAGWEHRKRQTLTDRRHCLEEGTRQLLRSGTTCVGDAGHYAGLIPQTVNSPMRMVLFPELLSGGESPAVQESYEGAFSQVEEILGSRSNRITAGVAPYAAYTLSRHLLKIIAQQAQYFKIPIQIHVSETFSEMQFFYESSGEIAEKLFPKIFPKAGWKEQMPPAHRQTPVQYLESIGFLETAPTLIGCNHLSEPDLRILAKSGAKVVHSPRSNACLKLGIPHLAKLSAAGVTVGLGTDGTASLHSLSLWDEMRHMQDHYPEAERPSAENLLEMATLDGAKALGLDKKVGSLEAGKDADVIAVRVPKELSLNDLAPWLVSHVTDREITAVFIEGKRVKIY